jgi:hypothetical protein
MIVLLFLAAVAAQCTPPTTGIRTVAAARICSKFDIEPPIGTYDVRLRVATTDGLSGVKVAVALVKEASCLIFQINDERSIAGFTDSKGTACFDRTVPRLRFCPRSLQPNITLVIGPFDFQYPAPLIYNVTFTRVGGCETTAPTPYPPPPPFVSVAPTPETTVTLPPRRFGVSSTVVTSAASRLCFFCLG